MCHFTTLQATPYDLAIGLEGAPYAPRDHSFGDILQKKQVRFMLTTVGASLVIYICVIIVHLLNLARG